MVGRQHVPVSTKKRLDGSHATCLSLYAIDLLPWIAWQQVGLEESGIPYNPRREEDDPELVIRYALVHWDQHLITADISHRTTFLRQAHWLVEHACMIGDDAAGWMVPSMGHAQALSPSLSAAVQGTGLSVLLRAYQLTGEEALLKVARRVVRTFERDVLDGGVSVPVGEDGIFFQATAAYPASHQLIGFLFAVLGLYDYLSLTGDVLVERLIQRALMTMHRLLDEFDSGYWTRSDLLSGNLASPADLALQIILLKALARASGCAHCFSLASHWQGYRKSFGAHLRSLVERKLQRSRRAVLARVRARIFPRTYHSDAMRVCVPVYGFPVMGGTRAVLANMAEVMAERWDIEYLTQRVEPHAQELIVHGFGTKHMAPWQFPAAWLYVLAGSWKLLTLLRHGGSYDLIMPQDGVFTAAFAALAAKFAGIRVVCIDHGNLTLLENQPYRAERLAALATLGWSPLRMALGRWQYAYYWPSLKIFAWLAAHLVDHFLVPGVAGDAIDQSCQRLGVPLSRITRFASMIDINRHALPEGVTREMLRQQKNLAPDAIVVALVCRLAPEKGIDVALESLELALATCSDEVRQRVCVVIAGDGPLHEHVKQEIVRRKLAEHCVLWGAIPHADVLALLQCSDIFLYTSTRGACFSMAVLEAMASGCAVVASTEPISNALLLAEDRGFAVQSGAPQQTGAALATLINDLDLCHRMGVHARDYVAQRHSGAMFARDLLRVSSWTRDEQSNRAMLQRNETLS
ncbi:MAG TPA: glycosyltransferase [Ktedonobacteraceae bacterium]|nr:glycosyltransferase [Ktedonobacteraceae bacterium]